MRIDVHWHSESKRVIHIIYHAGWDWDDFHAMRQQAKALKREVTHEVATFHEYDPDAKLLPVNALHHIRRALEEAEPNTGKSVLLAPSPMWCVLLQSLKRLMPNSILKQTYFANSHEEAMLLLKPYLNNEALQE